MGGAWSKWYLGLGTVETGELVLLGVLMLSSLLNIAYLMSIPIRGFFATPAGGTPYTQIQEAPKTILLAMIVTSTACVALFFYPEPFYQLAASAARGQ